uniref:Adhesion G protein-coupled receptor D1 n=1 Tax=Sphaeramia orbicularis TaxID=375764 RepID=A0A672ZTY1_9TELE
FNSCMTDCIWYSFQTLWSFLYEFIFSQLLSPVLATASHYWPLDDVNGIHELWDRIGKRPDIVEGMVNKGIFLNGDNGGTFLHFGNYQNTCISDPTLCGPEGITFSFFWKNHEAESRFAVASGGKVISNGFSVFTNPYGGYVEFYTRGNNHRWKANISVPGPFWTHILFTWTKISGLKVYINGTFTVGDSTGSISENYGDPHPDLVIGTGNGRSYSHYVTGAFDEFVIWERALSPDEILLYYNAAIGRTSETTAKYFLSFYNMAHLLYCFLPVDPRLKSNFRPYTHYIPSTAFMHNNKILNSEIDSLHLFFSPFLCIIFCLPAAFVVSFSLRSPHIYDPPLIIQIGLVLTSWFVSLLCFSQCFTLFLTSNPADYSLMKFPQNYNLPHYRFPTEGKNYISVPGEAFTMQCEHKYCKLKMFSNLSVMINEATDFKDHKIQVASCLISLKVEPSPALSVNLSGAPLIKIVLTHALTKEQQDQVLNHSNKVFLYCAFLDYSSNEGVWSNEGCVRSEGNMTYSVCLCNHLTNFAILMQVVPIELTTGHRVALSTIGYVGCSISIFCLAITLVTFAVLSSVSTIRNQRYHIHANLSFAILVAEILLLISARFDPGTLPCKIMAVLLHFFFLSAFAWMLVEGLHLYSMVVKVFGSEGSKHFYYYGIGWGSPLLICVVSMTSALDSYGEVDNCWLSLKNGAIWAFVAPALFVIVVNIGILISVTRIISRISGENYKVHGDANAVKLTAKAVAVLLPILGISWIFGVLAVNTHSLAFLYIFAIFNSLQGFFVFLFHCLLNSEVRAAFKHKTKVWSLTSSSIRNINVKPFNSDIMNGNKEGVTPTKMNTWDKSTNSANRIDLSAV